MGFLIGFLYVVIAVVSLILIGLVLIQDSKAGGLSAAIAGSGESFVGAAANKGITKFTGWLATGFLVLCLLVGMMTEKDKQSSSINISDPDAKQIGAPIEPGKSGESEAGGGAGGAPVGTGSGASEAGGGAAPGAGDAPGSSTPPSGG
ncbi:MAG: preprotein translocase subunit SecG [Planctomycetes bacterium]|nr:preprotein translocase subunit SecG [Planctomycetota bacterium]